MSRLLKAVAFMLCVGVFASAAAAWEIPLTVENHNRGGVPPFVSGGVPLLAGQAKETADLHLVVKDADGKATAIPAQFRVLARWWRADNSIRWVLVDYPTAPITSEKKVVYLTDAKVDAPKTELAVEDKDDAIVINTGAAEFTINKKKFNFIQKVMIEDKEVVLGNDDVGVVIEDMFGEKYYGSEGVKSVEVTDKGPVRIGLRAQGQCKARGGKGYSRGMYGYDITMNFYAGSQDMTADVVLTNNFKQSIGTPVMKDASLLVKLAGAGDPISGNCHLYGQAPFRGEFYKPEDGKALCMYQDSSGAETWELCQGYTGNSGPGGTCFQGKNVSFRGYHIIRKGVGPDNKEEVVATGDHARGLMLLTTGRGGAIMLMRNFWQQFPKAMEGQSTGILRLGMFPHECAVPNYLEDGSAKGHEIVLSFYVNGKSKYASDDFKRPWPHVVADAWDPPAYPRPPIEHIAATGALIDLGPSTVPARGYSDYDMGMNSRRMFMTDQYHGNAYGWQIFGERWLSHGGHSQHGARQPIKEDYYLLRYYWTGGPNWLEVGNNRSRNFRDVRAYRVEDQDGLAFKDFDDFRKSNFQEDGWCKRAEPNDADAKKYEQGKWERASFEYPNPEHQTLDLLYDRYCLFGDQRAYENMRTIAACGGFFAEKNSMHIIRAPGWSWRVLERYWELTGDKKAEELLHRVVKTALPLASKEGTLLSEVQPDPSDYQSWHYMIWSRPLAMTALQLGDPDAVTLLKKVAEGHEDKADYHCTVFAVLYHLTGDVKYKDAVMKASNNGEKTNVVTDVDAPNWSHMGHVFPCAAMWLLNQPPAKK